MHENVWRGTLAEAVVFVNSAEPRGEYALVIGPAPSTAVEISDGQIATELRSRLESGLSRRDAVDEVTTALGVPRKRVYAVSLDL